ncbi:MAG: hypothetical protein PHY48_10755 [Candidatus Cloacimonetes bacterium]|nr:hypothetical protein [Candidatus Cloacimonadota bacterium]
MSNAYAASTDNRFSVSGVIQIAGMEQTMAIQICNLIVSEPQYDFNLIDTSFAIAKLDGDLTAYSLGITANLINNRE